MDEQKENKLRKLDKEAKKVLEESLIEHEPTINLPIPEGRVKSSETKWIKEQADGKQQEKEWEQRESAKPELNDPTITHPVQAYSYKMEEPAQLESMMWEILEKIGFLPTYHHNNPSEVYFELGKIYREFMTKLQVFVESKGK